jgi:glycosyltransferase involved in cell wall biosynthesis
MTPEPLVSVIIPVFNGERHVADAIASVLAQRHHALEVIVVDDGSTDASADVVCRIADARCRLVTQPSSGAAAARNRGISESTGALLAFLDADDVWTPDKLDRQLLALTANPEIDMAFGHYVTFGGGHDASDARPGYSLGTMLVRRESFLRVGLLSTAWRVGEFIDWYARAEEAGLRHAMLPDVLLRRRAHDDNLTTRQRHAAVDYARIVRGIAARRARLRSEAT